MSVQISAAVEGPIDEAIVRRLVSCAGGEVTRVYLGHGKQGVLKNASGYNNAARFSPWTIVVDLDHDCECAPPCRQRWLSDPAPWMCFRIAVRAIEAWLLADRERISNLLRVETARVPMDPEGLADPKGALVDLARRSRSSRVRDDLVPRPQAGRRVGPLYTARLLEFVTDAGHGWRPEIAAATANSLDRCLKSLTALTRQAAP